MFLESLKKAYIHLKHRIFVVNCNSKDKNKLSKRNNKFKEYKKSNDKIFWGKYMSYKESSINYKKVISSICICKNYFITCKS